MNIPREKLEQWRDDLRIIVATDPIDAALDPQRAARIAAPLLSSIEAELEQPQQPDSVHMTSAVPAGAPTTPRPKFTPGPWRVATCGDADCWCRIVISDALPDDDLNGVVVSSGAVGKDDAQLIAATHDLLEAAQWLNVTGVMVPGTDGREVSVPRDKFDLLLAAIAKATGMTADGGAVEAESGRHGSNKTEPAPSQPQGEQSTAPSDVREQAREQCPYASAPHRGYWIEGYCYRAARAQSTAPESPQAAAQSTALEPARWESRVWMDGCGGEPVGWGDWETVKPRNPNMDTVADRVAEFKSLIAAGYRYELRPLYATPSAAMALLGEASDDLKAWLTERDNAYTEDLIARIDAITGTGRKERP